MEKMKRRLTYPFLKCADRDQKDQCPTDSPNESALLFSFSVISSDLGGMFWQTWLSCCWRQHWVSQIFFRLIWLSFQKYVMEINDIPPAETFILSTCFVSTVTHPPILTVIFFISSSLSLLSNLPAKPVGSILTLTTSLSLHFFH